MLSADWGKKTHHDVFERKLGS